MKNIYPPELENFEIFFVDLDGSLIAEDLSFQSFKAYLKQKPWKIFEILLQLVFYRQKAKKIMCEAVVFEKLHFTLNDELLALLEYLKGCSKKIVLATGSFHHYAEKIAAAVGVFDAVLATSMSVNFIGKNKLAGMKDFAGGKTFVYIGNSRVDLEVWAGSPAGIVVNASEYVRKQARQMTSVLMEF